MIDLTNAVHWLIDDIGYDQRPVIDDVGIVLRSNTEALAVQAAVDSLVAVLDSIGPLARDSDYVSSNGWTEVMRAATSALDALNGD